MTTPTRAALGTTVAAALAVSEIPHHFRGGLIRYFGEGIVPGGFLQAVLANDLRLAIARAGPGSVLALEPLVRFLDDHAPAAAWGSAAAVAAWTTTPERLEV